MHGRKKQDLTLLSPLIPTRPYRPLVETKGLEDLDVPQKMEHLKRWCDDANAAQDKARFDYVFVDAEDFERYRPDSLAGLVRSFRGYKEG